MGDTFRILVVDDDAMARITLVDVLRCHGYDAESVPSGVDALVKVFARDFDCILTDVDMPRMNGTELCGLLRKYRERLPVFFMTGYDASDERVRKGIRLGSRGVFEKPVHMPSLLEVLKSLRNGNGKERRLSGDSGTAKAERARGTEREASQSCCPEPSGHGPSR